MNKESLILNAIDRHATKRSMIFSLSKSQLEFIDNIAFGVNTSRTEVIRWMIHNVRDRCLEEDILKLRDEVTSQSHSFHRIHLHISETDVMFLEQVVEYAKETNQLIPYMSKTQIVRLMIEYFQKELDKEDFNELF